VATESLIGSLRRVLARVGVILQSLTTSAIFCELASAIMAACARWRRTRQRENDSSRRQSMCRRMTASWTSPPAELAPRRRASAHRPLEQRFHFALGLVGTADEACTSRQELLEEATTCSEVMGYGRSGTSQVARQGRRPFSRLRTR